ncbi:hypothetical protein [Microbacterium sp. No. 7]|uniref:hypothetical protein n=1 Tax=Microbacterium sp. No. 7 TaxID=1714373 RepID=UPI0012E1F263|nr:hypothetical protein [Microbacterium sp. No. 7]
MGALIEQTLSDEMSDWDRAVLERARETGQISHADYLEGVGLYEDCMSVAGIPLVRTDHPNGLVELQPGAAPADEEGLDILMRTNHECMSDTYGAIQELYRYQQGNPDLLRDSSEVVVRCLADAGVIDDRFDRDDFQAQVLDDFTPERLPFDIMDPQVQSCLHVAGIAFLVDE